MKKILIVFAVALVAMLSSCSAGRYVNSSANLNVAQTQVVLSEANFTVVKNISIPVVYTQDWKKFSAEQLKQAAYAQLLKEAKLTGSQALINVTVENVRRSQSNLFGVKKYDDAIIVSGTVIEFTK